MSPRLLERTLGTAVQTSVDRSPATIKRKYARISSTHFVDAVAFTDFVFIIAAAAISKIIYIDWFLGKPDRVGETGEPTIELVKLGMLLAFICFFVFRRLGLYGPSNLLLTRLNAATLLLGFGASYTILLSILFFSKSSGDYSRGWMLTWFLICAVFIIGGRASMLSIVRRRGWQTALKRKVAVYGFGSDVKKMRDTFATHYPNLDVIGFFCPQPGEYPAEVAGGLETLISLGQNDSYDEVIIVLPLSDKPHLGAVLRKLSVLPVDLVLLPDLDPTLLQYDSSKIVRLPVFKVLKRPLSDRQCLAKTAVDHVLGGLALLLLAPLLALIAIAIKVDSPGPVFFLQRRHGYNHKVFRIVKFRTMTVLEDTGEIRQASTNDNRVTRVGRFLRRTSLDELPQLWNVIKGEMSLIGPRPHALSHNEDYAGLWSEYSYRHRVKPGITGWAQVNGLRGETSASEDMRKRLEFDLYYIENWSLWFDLKILLQTAVTVLFGKNAY